jgi:hypothetical protein
MTTATKIASTAKARAAIESHGVLLVYPIKGRTQVASLWSVLHPRTEMRWGWDAGADARISAMWDLRERLARTRDVVYVKWLAGRATFFSRSLFRATLATLRARGDLRRGLGRDATDVLDLLLESSPQATGAVRDATGMAGRAREGDYTRATRALWSRLLVVGVGEVAERGFPSLQMAATALWFEDLWTEAEALAPADERRVDEACRRSPAFARTLRRALAELPG